MTLARPLISVPSRSPQDSRHPPWRHAAHLLALAGLAAALPAQVATFTSMGQGCGGTGPAGFYELFATTSPNDLAGRGLTMLFTGTSYVVLPGAGPLVAPAGAPAGFADDETLSTTLPWPLPHPGGSTSRLWVCSNGWIAYESTTSTSYTESVAELLSGPARLCVFWDDLNPAAGGSIHLHADAAGFHVTWSGVPEYPSTGANTLQASFQQSGQIELRWGTISAQDGLVGYHPGHGGADPGPSDLTAISALLLGDGRMPLTLANANSQRPVLGQVFTTRISEIPAGAQIGVLVMSLTLFTPPLDLSGLGMVGCTQHCMLESTRAFFPGGSTASLPINFAFPGAAQFAGLHFYVQAAVFHAGSPGGMLTSNGGDLLLGVL